MIKTSLEALKAFFHKEGYQAEIEPESEISPEQLVVLIGRDHKENDLLLRLTLIEENSIYFLQFFQLLPYEIEESALSETSRLILSINSSFDLAGFGIIEGNRLLFHRYVHVGVKEFSEEVLRALIDSQILLLDTFLPSIAAVASGDKNIEALQKETKATVQSLEFEIL